MQTFSLIATKSCEVQKENQNKEAEMYISGNGSFTSNSGQFECWQTVKKEVTGYQGSRQLTKNTLSRWRPLTDWGYLRKDSSWLADHVSFQQVASEVTFIRTLLHSCSVGPSDAEVRSLCVSFNSTSKRLIMELIRANPLWGSTKLDLRWRLRHVFILSRG